MSALYDVERMNDQIRTVTHAWEVHGFRVSMPHLSAPKFLGSPIRQYSMTHSKQILRADQTIIFILSIDKRKIFTVDHAPSFLKFSKSTWQLS